ncbi:hypothetical protein J7413_03060 [Shimia sp. R10_1]|uniref:hypothetical protein n=1 Tax=Shimia sp. R10_1 TaxID=2821095 RepID=UPI001ADC6084|nr:hypothetical protein [Shimia sp. R10_1]MBO9472507.1 hypothetical protein [Shimia sp. R10_1]
MTSVDDLNARISVLEARLRHYSQVVAVLDGRRAAVETTMYRLFANLTLRGDLTAQDLHAVFAENASDKGGKAANNDSYTDGFALGRLAQNKQLQEVVLPALLAHLPNPQQTTSNAS